MKFSKLNSQQLTIDEKYELIMAGIKNYAKEKATEADKVDFLVVLGCTPVPLKARVIKASELYRMGYAQYVLFSGGKAWNQRFIKDPKKLTEMVEAYKKMVKPELIGSRLSDREKKINQLVGSHSTVEDEKVTKRILSLSESQLMSQMMISLGNVPANCIFHEPFSNNTKENMENTKKLFQSLVNRGEVPPIKSVMVVTSSFHCRRAMLTFRKYFKNLRITACPATLDLKERGVEFSKEGMLSNQYYREQIERELDAIINYSRNGTIEDVDIAEAVDKKFAKKIEDRQARFGDEI